MLKDFDGWEVVDYNKRSINNSGKGTELYLSKTAYANKVKSLFYIPADIVETLGWKEGTMVTLFKSGTLYMLKARPGGIEKLKKPSEGSRALRIVSVNMALHLGLTQKQMQSNEPVFFDYQLDCSDGGAIVFSARKDKEEKGA